MEKPNNKDLIKEIYQSGIDYLKQKARSKKVMKTVQVLNGSDNELRAQAEAILKAMEPEYPDPGVPPTDPSYDRKEMRISLDGLNFEEAGGRMMGFQKAIDRVVEKYGLNEMEVRQLIRQMSQDDVAEELVKDEEEGAEEVVEKSVVADEPEPVVEAPKPVVKEEEPVVADVPEPVKAEPVRPEPEPVKPEPVKPEPLKPEPVVTTPTPVIPLVRDETEGVEESRDEARSKIEKPDAETEKIKKEIKNDLFEILVKVRDRKMSTSKAKGILSNAESKLKILAEKYPDDEDIKALILVREDLEGDLRRNESPTLDVSFDKLTAQMQREIDRAGVRIESPQNPKFAAFAAQLKGAGLDVKYVASKGSPDAKNIVYFPNFHNSWDGMMTFFIVKNFIQLLRNDLSEDDFNEFVNNTDEGKELMHFYLGARDIFDSIKKSQNKCYEGISSLIDNGVIDYVYLEGFGYDDDDLSNLLSDRLDKVERVTIPALIEHYLGDKSSILGSGVGEKARKYLIKAVKNDIQSNLESYDYTLRLTKNYSSKVRISGSEDMVLNDGAELPDGSIDPHRAVGHNIFIADNIADLLKSNGNKAAALTFGVGHEWVDKGESESIMVEKNPDSHPLPLSKLMAYEGVNVFVIDTLN